MTKTEYDQSGRVLTIKKSLNGSSSEKLIASYVDDELGRVKRKNLGVNPLSTSMPLEVQEMEYNIRGWVSAINKKYANSEPGADNYFGIELDYDYGFTESQYNGNISGTKWRSKGDPEQRAYGFTYDFANRLKKADFSQNNGSWILPGNLNFTVENVAYDYNGNISSLKQWGSKLTTSSVIDDLVYTYKNSGVSNQLIAVNEQNLGNTNNNLKDFTDNNASIDDYYYDSNGNLKYDKNKGVTNIDYNYLNLPSIVYTNKGSITFTYDALGNKLKKEVNEIGQAVKTTYYIDGFVYENSSLQFVAHEEGRMRYDQSTSTWKFDYYIKDNLGNVRLVLTEEEKLNSFPALSYEGASGSQQIIDQNDFWDNSASESINVTSARTARPGSFGTQSSNGDYVQLLRKSTGAVGATKLLKVMSGDRIHVRVDYYHTSPGANNSALMG